MLKAVSEQIVNVKVDDAILQRLKNQFFGIMRENGICQGVALENGVLGDSPEWAMCWAAFISRIDDALECSMFFEDIPNDLIAHEEGK